MESDRLGLDVRIGFMMPPTDQVFMGSAVALCCVVGLVKHRWFLQETPKGQRLIRRFGEAGGARVLCGLLIIGAVFGGLMAVGVIHPIRWE